MWAGSEESVLEAIVAAGALGEEAAVPMVV